jgi:hypothetical protein
MGMSKNESHIEIRVVNNGYMVLPKDNGQGYYMDLNRMWAFESLESLNKRLHEIVSKPYEMETPATDKE